MRKTAGKLQQLLELLKRVTRPEPEKEPKVEEPAMLKTKVTPARKEAMRLLATMRKHAAEDYPELDEGRGVGQRFFEGGMRGAGAGTLAGGGLGAILGGVGGYTQSKGDLKEKILAALMGALKGGVAGAGSGAVLGGALGAGGGALAGSRTQQPTY